MKRKIGIVLLLVGIFGASVGLGMGVMWWIDGVKTEDVAKNAVSQVSVADMPGGEGVQDENEIDESDPYWDFMKMNMMEVDFSELLSENKDTVGWIRVEGTNINYPVVRSGDNDYYLNHSFDKSWNSAGWVFLDYRNNLEELGKNTIIYAHGRYDETMFGSLKNALTSGWTNDSGNYVVKMSSSRENTLWQVFSVYEIPTTSDYLKIEFSDDMEFEEFAEKLLERSQFDFRTGVSANDKILTLSTCGSEKTRVVMHAKLIKVSEK